MELSEQQLRFLAQRRKMLRAWVFVGPSLVVIVLGFGLWLLLRTPWLINPAAAEAKLTSGAANESLIMLMAMMLPWMFLICLMTLVIVIAYLFVAAGNEKKYLAIIDRLTPR